MQPGEGLGEGPPVLSPPPQMQHKSSRRPDETAVFYPPVSPDLVKDKLGEGGGGCTGCSSQKTARPGHLPTPNEKTFVVDLYSSTL